MFRAIIHLHATPVLVADNDRKSIAASAGVERLLGIPPAQIVDRSLDDLVEPSFSSHFRELWHSVLQQGEQSGTLPLVGEDGRARMVQYEAKGNVLPSRHILAIRDRSVSGESGEPDEKTKLAAGFRDYALFLLDTDGRIASWYAGAARIFGYTAAEAIGRHESLLYPRETGSVVLCRERLARTALADHSGDEGWQLKKDGSRFWANTITRTLRDDSGKLQGFARVVRDFGERHEQDETLRRNREILHALPSRAHIAGIVSGEFDHIPEVNDAFLELVGYSRDDLSTGKLRWPNLTPPEYLSLDELAHEEALRFGACTPFEKELIRKDGSRVPVLVATATLKLSPFRWITFVQDLRERNAAEGVAQDLVEGEHVFEEMVGASSALRRVKDLLEVVAPTDATVLILGETGTGKELVARAIHRISPRRNLPFISLNCAAIPTGLLESELFGYERGAFTGALQQKIGRFEMAHRGTLFLDEVGDIPLDLQPKLLRALQEKSFERLGGTKTIPIDVRLVAATNRNLTQMMEDKLFRVDLFYRLKVFPITTPPLRDRPDDIPILARHFTTKYALKMGKNIDRIPAETIRTLAAWPWPGNVRELENFIERSVILTQGPALRAPLEEIRPSRAKAAADDTLDHVDREHILRILRECEGVVSNAALRLGLPRTTLNALMRKLNISRADF